MGSVGERLAFSCQDCGLGRVFTARREYRLDLRRYTQIDYGLRRDVFDRINRIVLDLVS